MRRKWGRRSIPVDSGDFRAGELAVLWPTVCDVLFEIEEARGVVIAIGVYGVRGRFRAVYFLVGL